MQKPEFYADLAREYASQESATSVAKAEVMALLAVAAAVKQVAQGLGA